MWGQLDLAEPDSWGSATTWMNRYCDRKPGLYGGFDTTGMSHMDELKGRLDNIVHRIDYRDADLLPKFLGDVVKRHAHASQDKCVDSFFC